MGFRFFRRIRLAPGLTLNLSKRGGSLSFGPRGAKLTAGTSGVRRTVSLPGSGLWYTEKVGGASQGGRGRREDAPPMPRVTPKDRLSLGFFQRLLTPPEEKDLVLGLRQFFEGDRGYAYQTLRKVDHLADAAFAAATMALQAERLEEAEKLLVRALDNRAKLGHYFRKYGVTFTVSIPITTRISAHLEPGVRGARLMLAELHQLMGKWERAADDLRRLHRSDPIDPIVTLSLCEILVLESGDEPACREVVRLAAAVENISEIHAAILLWKAKALHRLGLNEAARDALTLGLRRRKDRSDALLQALRYERAGIYEALGQRARARSELEHIYASNPGYEDVAKRLG